MEVEKPYTPNIHKVLQRIREQGYFAGLERFAYENYDVEHALKVVEAIGKSRNPRFVIDAENRFAYENFIKWSHGDTTMKALNAITGEEQQGDIKRGIYMAGNTGSGKSWCLEVMRAYVSVLGFKIRFSGNGELRRLAWSISRADDICEDFAENGSIGRFKRMPILGIQDVGQEPRETLHMGNRLNVIQQLLEYRGDRTDEITLITSNLRISGEILKERYGDRVQSRLVEMCNYLEVKGKDRRKGI